MTAATTPITELRTLDTPSPGASFWDALHEQLTAAALDAGTTATDVRRGAATETAVAPRRAHPRRRPTIAVLGLAAAAVVAVLVGVAALGPGGNADRRPGDVAGPDPTDTQRPIEPAPAPSTAPAPATSTQLSRSLSKGLAGDDVKMVQQRLADLKFDPGPVDGAFGDYTTQAVWAFETLVLGTRRQDVTGKVTPEMWEVMQGDVVVAPRRTNLTSTHVEIYLPEQALVVFKDDQPALIAHISSGELAEPGDDFTKGKEWCQEVTISPGEIGNEDGTEPIKDGRCGDPATPGGTYRFYRKVEGRRESALGGMYDPVYFNYGIAVHGAENVPDEPASHGCIRINRRLGPIFQSMITKLGKNSGDQVYVWNGVKEPEAYGAKPGRFDWPWQEWRDAQGTAPPD